MVELLGAQGHAHHTGAQSDGSLLGQGAPAAADFEHTLARLYPGHFQGTLHLGVLRLRQGAAQVALKPGAGVVHGFVQPQAVKGIAQVVMGMDVLAAVGAAVVLQQVLDAVQQAPQPGAEDHGVDLLAVRRKDFQQFGQIWRGPVAGNKAFRKADVAGLERCAEHVPVVQGDAGTGMVGAVHGVLLRMLAKTALRAVRQVQGERTVAQVLQQAQGAAGSGRCAFGKGLTGSGGSGCVHGWLPGLGASARQRQWVVAACERRALV